MAMLSVMAPACLLLHAGSFCSRQGSDVQSSMARHLASPFSQML